MTMTPRQERGLVIAATKKLTQRGKVWLVPSQSGNSKYTVCPDDESPFCSCPDHEETGQPCKHIFAVQFAVNRERGSNGTVTETRTLTLTEKKTYPQNWPAHYLAQTTEKNRLQAILHDLCKRIEEPEQPKVGRRHIPIADAVFSCVFKIYCGMSLRRFACDLNEAFEKGYLSQKLSPMTTCAYLHDEALTPVLQKLVAESAGPLRAIESDFAVDSSGFSSSRFVRWFDQKYGCVRQEHDWVKVHISTGVKTNVVTAVTILDKDAADCPQFPGLVKQTAERFQINEVSADKAYLSRENVETVFQFGGTPFIAFKSNSTGSIGGLFAKMFHHYAANRDDYLARYHKRSLVESTFSMVKAKFGDGVRNKTQAGMKNEVLCKLLAHNICCLIQSQCELGIEPTFWSDKSNPVPVKETPEPITEIIDVSAGSRGCPGC